MLVFASSVEFRTAELMSHLCYQNHLDGVLKHQSKTETSQVVFYSESERLYRKK